MKTVNKIPWSHWETSYSRDQQRVLSPSPSKPWEHDLHLLILKLIHLNITHRYHLRCCLLSPHEVCTNSYPPTPVSQTEVSPVKYYWTLSIAWQKYSGKNLRLSHRILRICPDHWWDQRSTPELTRSCWGGGEEPRAEPAHSWDQGRTCHSGMQR